MVIGVARIVVHIPASQSLKDKRQVLRSLIAQVQQRFRISVAEVDRHDQWQMGVIGLACVSTSTSHANEVISKAVGFMGGLRIDAEILDYETEFIHPF